MSIDVSGLQAMLDKLNKLEEEINETIPEFVKECAEIATDEATNNFASAIYAGTNDVTVNSPIIDGTSATVSASGSAVNFIEFGTGIFYPDVHPDMGLNGFSRGSYGKGKGSNPKGWAYQGDPGNSPSSYPIGKGYVRTRGNPANMCMYKAREHVSENAVDIWKEVSK